MTGTPAVATVDALDPSCARKSAIEPLARPVQSEALQNAIFNSAYFGMMATDEKGVIQVFNIGAECMLGYLAADVVDRITPADISDPSELIERAAALSVELGTAITPGFEALVFKASRGIEDIYELTYVRKDGSRFPAIVSVTGLRDAEDTIIGYLLIGTDNTVRNQVEETRNLLDQQLRDQQFYVRSLIESNLDALMMTDRLGVISDVNEQMVKLTGQTRDELIGAPSQDFFTNPELARAAIERVLAEDKVSDYELTVRSKNGDATVVSYNAATFRDRDGNVQGVFAAARDATERKRFEFALQETNVQLEHASKMKSEFLATMSHELRTPLNAIIGFSEALNDGLMGELTERQHEYIGDIFTSGQHLLSLINDILDLSKVEAGMMTLELEPGDLTGLLSDSLSIVRERAAQNGVTVSLAGDEGFRSLVLDLRKTKQIVYNLLSNAVKFTGVGGTVTLSVRSVPRSSVGSFGNAWASQTFSLPENEYAEFLEISVTDNGIGISKADMAKLFQAFSQIDSSLARRFEGTGLGLAMVRQLAELHGGTVAVASAEGEGACFSVWLPVREDCSYDVRTQVARGGAASLQHEDSGADRTALVVEDDDRAAELVRLLLEAEGFSVVRAASAEEALEIAPLQELALITLDVQLPGMDGWEFLLHIREDAELASVPVVIIAGVVDSNFALAGGAAAILQKPISRAQLQYSLANLGMSGAGVLTSTVLVVDDDPKAVELIAAFLNVPEYAVVRAYGGVEAINLAHRLLPDLILLDLMMPEVSGFDVVKALQRDPATARIPILVVTAKQISPLDRAALNPDPDHVIQIIDKAGFNRSAFMAEVRLALPSNSKEAAWQRS